MAIFLCIETDVFYFDILRITIEEKGHKLISAARHLENIEQAYLKFRPDGVISEIDSSIADLPSCLRKFRKEFPKVPFVILSGSIFMSSYYDLIDKLKIPRKQCILKTGEIDKEVEALLTLFRQQGLDV